jgi:hypothetical protein
MLLKAARLKDGREERGEDAGSCRRMGKGYMVMWEEKVPGMVK